MLKSVTLLASLAPYLNLVPYVDAQSQGSNMVPLGGASVAFICPNGNYMQFTSISGNNVMSCSGGTQPDVGPFAMLNNFNVDSNGTGSAQALTDGGTYYLNVQGHGATEFMTATPYNRPNDNGDYTLQTSTYGGPSGTGFHNYECAFNFYIQPDGRYKIQAIANNGPYNSNAMPIHDGPDEGYWSVQSDETIFTPNTVGPGDADIFSIVLAPTSSVQQSFATSDNLDSNTEFTIQNSITGNFWEYTNGVYSATASQSSASTFMISNSTIHTGLNGLFDISRNQYVSIPSNSSAATGSTSEITRETEMIIIPVGSQQYVIWTQTNPGAYLTSADGGLYPTGSEPEVNTFVAIGSTAVAKPTIETMTTFSSSTLDSAPSSTTSENLSFTSSNSVVTSAVSTSSDLVEPTAITGLSTSSSTSLTYQVTATSEPLPSTTSAPMVAFTTVSSSLSAVLTSDAVVPSPMANNGAAASSSSSSAAAAAAGAQSATDFSEFVSSTSSAGSCMTYDNVPDCFADATSPECTQLAEDSDALRFVKVTVATPSMSTVSVARISIFSAPSVTLSSTTPSSSSSLTPVPASSSSFGSGAAVAALSQSGLTTSTRSAVALPVGETGIANLPVETSASASAPVLSPSATSSAGNAVSANQEDSAPNASAANTAPNSQEVSIGDEATFNPSPSGSDVSAAQVVGRPINVSNNASDIATSPSGSVASVDSAESGVTNNTDFSTAAVMGTIASITSVTAPAASYQSTLVTKIAGETTVLSSASMATASTGSDVSNENGGTASTYAPSPSSTPSTASSSSSTGMPSVAALPASTSDSSALKSTMSCLAAVLSVLFFI
ncbi:protein of unknown function [Taphrina deformans PYCC 5710]|uniref:Uncharacterized protein n=1 Tax=Taphrina deformans (strain PYCC 5710 / ATCC 11124 / CBS 356.35 / IMI 108563 / JCM 9778 / NBRC 8474) TaxID=1097556 RepID=R4X8H0_TAPDE|nr:protein of unknown function [Taphrina deformans PYCC 5710]|eukprot:CCG81601.1 protein of unknown function [Taphrina deformans PYCC 5710]